MVARAIPQYQKMIMCKQIARDHHHFIVNRGNDVKPVLLLYREAEPRNVLVGKRSSVDGMLALVKKATGFK